MSTGDPLVYVLIWMFLSCFLALCLGVAFTVGGVIIIAKLKE